MEVHKIKNIYAEAIAGQLKSHAMRAPLTFFWLIFPAPDQTTQNVLYILNKSLQIDYKICFHCMYRQYFDKTYNYK